MRRLLFVLCSLLVVWGCKKPRKEQLYFDDLRPPVGIKATIVSDVSLNPTSGGNVRVNVVVAPDADRDELDRLLQSLHRQVKGRDFTFKKHEGKLQTIDIRVYDSEQKAQSGGEDWLARAFQNSSVEQPTFTNRQKLPLLKWAKKLLGEQTKYQVLADPDALTLDYTEPFLEEGKPVEEIKYEVFANDLIRTLDDLFRGIPQLKKLTYSRTHNDKVVAKVWLTHEQFISMNMRPTLEKEYNAVVGPLVQELATGEITEAKYIKIKRKQIRIVLRKLLSMLPEQQVQLIKDLQ
jgi:hypothetical protein